MQSIDPKFRTMGRGARRRRRQMLALRGAAVALIIGLGGGLVLHQTGLPRLPPISSPPPVTDAGVSEADQSLVPLEEDIDLAPVVTADTFTDIPGDPMIIEGPADGSANRVTNTVGPPGLSVARVGPPSPARLTLISDDLYVRERRLVAALPTTREEFALFQAERSRAGQMIPQGVGPVQSSENVVSSTVFTRDSGTRALMWQDLILEVQVPTPLDRLLAANGFDERQAQAIAVQVADALALKGDLPRQTLVALRYRVQDDHRQVLQLSLYRGADYVGSLALGRGRQLAPASDPWAGDALGQAADRPEGGDGVRFRLLDVMYSAAIRNEVPTEIVGDAIALMSRVYDLNSLAAEGDRLRLIYTSQPVASDGKGGGRILFAGITGPSGDKPCYVVSSAKESYTCHAPGARVVAVTEQVQMLSPVAGVLVQRFTAPGGNMDAADAGVIWQAAQGTPVVTAAAGQVETVQIDPRRGPSVSVRLPGGQITRYAGLAALPVRLQPGAAVPAGAPLGEVGPKAGVKGVGLFFQVLDRGLPVDPVPYLTGGNEVLASNAVETLIGRIIHVESGGNTRARNPLSTASGLGQFIEGTWLRMMRTYRADLASSMSRADLLELRFQPDLSRQMVRNLAQENEAFLRSRGHAITPGRLYLAHFLGPAGASQVLSADPASSVGAVMGQAVVSANPFLRNYTIADLRNWADRKMQGRAVAAATSVPSAQPEAVSPEVRAFVAMMDEMLVQDHSIKSWDQTPDSPD